MSGSPDSAAAYLVERVAWLGPAGRPLELCRRLEWVATCETEREALLVYQRCRDAAWPVAAAVALLRWTAADQSPPAHGNYATRYCALDSREWLVKGECRHAELTLGPDGHRVRVGEWGPMPADVWLDLRRDQPR